MIAANRFGMRFMQKHAHGDAPHILSETVKSQYFSLNRVFIHISKLWRL
jgi:hypothetical protein